MRTHPANASAKRAVASMPYERWSECTMEKVVGFAGT